MKKIIFHSPLFLAAFILLICAGFKVNKRSGGVPVAIIVNAENPVNTLTAGEVKLYWLRKIKSRWPVINKNIKPVDRKSKCSEQETFYWKVLSMTTDDVETYFITRQYQNAQKPQEKFNSDKEIIEFVSEEPGAIGFINAASFSGEAKSKVKVVLTVNN